MTHPGYFMRSKGFFANFVRHIILFICVTIYMCVTFLMLYQRTTTLSRPIRSVLKGVDSDNGSEFINQHLYLYRYCGKNKIQFTCSRPYKEDDLIEQKNWTHVRKLVRWDW